eukprot:CAMPEP_0197029216 /NCGR_PEP_ID=MMETSP1384-20130603/8713_1 /TAXON_ID=29189 /ORGANISM="Ammonia sp." /LENGTH=471 /DNA_ID=CAMNT_0042458339 /DNA_START=100 /DNA_END=1515 /DNA_ORIENTATION=+
MSQMSTMQHVAAHQPQATPQHAELDVISSFLAMHTASTNHHHAAPAAQQMDLEQQQFHGFQNQHTNHRQQRHHHQHHHHHHDYRRHHQSQTQHRTYCKQPLSRCTLEHQEEADGVQQQTVWETQHVQTQTDCTMLNTASQVPLVATLSADTASSTSTSASTSTPKANLVHDDEIEGEPVHDAEVEIEYTDDEDSMHHNEEFVILLDWDDTLFPTSMINEILQSRNDNDLALVRDDQIEYLNELGRLTLILLNELIDRYGAHNIHIVTNSLDGWIKESLNYASCISKLYKQIELVLLKNRITMLSAQSLYAKRIKNSTPTQWKQYCFDEILKNSHKQYSHILSIGDQWTDHYAVKQSIAGLTYYAQPPIHHVIKLKMLPNVNDMINENLYLQACFTQIFNVLSSQKLSSTATKAIRPVIIDYHNEELKYMQQYYQSQQQQACNININNVNVNVNLNVNVIKNDSATPKQFNL